MHERVNRGLLTGRLAALLCCTFFAACSSCSTPDSKGADGGSADDGGGPNNGGGTYTYEPGAACASLGTFCDGVCTATQTDTSNCGGCGVACDDGRSCVAGRCVAPCTQRALAADLRLVGEVSSEPLNAGAVADLDGDGLREYVLLQDGEYSLQYASGYVFIHEEQADGTTAKYDGAFATNSEPETILFADFDGDGRTDFVVLGPEPHANQRTSNKLTTVLTTEDGYAEVMNEAPGIARDGFARDWDGDGDEDVILTDGYTVWIGRNDGSALFSFEELRTIESEISALLARDLDGDGVEELIARTYKEPRNINVHSLVEPFGDFLAAQITGEGVTTFGLGDLDADGTDELVAASDGLVEVFRAGDGFSYEPLGSIESSERVRALDVGDADGDGRAEVYTVEGQRIDLADGTLVASIGPTGIYGYSDAVRVEEGYGTVLLSSSRSLGGPGHLLEATIRDNSSRSGVAYYGERTKLLASGLIDGDDLPDLAFFAHELLGWWSSSSGEVRTMALEESFSDVKFRHVGRGLEAYLWTGVNDGVVSRVRLGDTFDVTALTPDGEWSAAKDSIFADLDRDGVDEWLSYNGVVQIDGTSLTFQPLADEDIVAASDLDDDGLVDLVTTQGIWTGSSGGFSKHSEWSVPDALVGAADVNGDGVGDLYGPGGVAFGGTLPPRLVAAPSGGWSDVVFPYDFDGDGNSEIVDVTFEELTGRISRLSSDAWAPAPQTVLTGQDVQTALVLDLDLDGHLDVVVGVDRGIRVLAGSCAE